VGTSVEVWKSAAYCVEFEVREELVGVETGGLGWWRMQGVFQDAVQWLLAVSKLRRTGDGCWRLIYSCQHRLNVDCWAFQGYQTWAKVLRMSVLLAYCLDVRLRAFYVTMRTARS